MKRYEHTTPRAMLGGIAVALTALTIGLFAVLPAQTGPSQRVQEIATAAARHAPQPAAAPTELRYIDPIDVVAVRAPKVISTQEREMPAKRGDQG